MWDRLRQDVVYAIRTFARVLESIVRHALSLTATGMVAGFLLALIPARAMANVLFGVGSADPATFTAVGVTLLLVSVGACSFPALRASRVDPMRALRTD